MSKSGKGSKSVNSSGGGGGKRHNNKVLKNPSRGITKPAIRRMARRGGVKRISDDAYDEVMIQLTSFLEKILQDSMIYTTHSKRKTINGSDVICSLRNNGHNLYGYNK